MAPHLISCADTETPNRELSRHGFGCHLHLYTFCHPDYKELQASHAWLTALPRRHRTFERFVCVLGARCG